MDEKKKKCWNCKHYSAYYTKKLCHFEKEDCGFCRQQGKITDKHHTCERWCFNGIRRQIRKNVALKALKSSLDNLVEIRQILIDEIDDNKKNPI